LDTLEEMDEFHSAFNLQRKNYKEIENINRQIMSKDIEYVINKKSPFKEISRTRWLCC
jgi:hypothetical protein